ncbi:MAG TPA: TRCF domain-containing protein, partial [Planctomycetota bacterium]|nr:TRCF domain-containing protein [Planctomycetota bacterium]
PRLKTELDQIVPEARTEFAHGQMKESALEAKMLAFLSGEIDVLIATTIVENGIDVPSANTIIISEADLYGLADLHQMRGRVGRSSTQAYCYLFLPEHRHVNPEARKRLQALVEFSGLGAGFQIAMRDLELRGAGNILGKEQSGHIAAVGYDMYCRLLEKCVRELEKKPTVEPVAVEIDLTVDARIPDGFLRGESEKIELYRRVSQLADADAVAELLEELEDRYGECPPSVRRLLDVQKMRLLCRDYGVVYVGHEDDNLLVKGSEAMERLLRGCSRRVAVLDSRTVAVPLFERRRRFGEPIESERIFDFFLTWLETGSCPDAPPPRTLDSDGKRKPSESSKSPEKPEKPTRRGRGVARAARRSE